MNYKAGFYFMVAIFFFRCALDQIIDYIKYKHQGLFETSKFSKYSIIFYMLFFGGNAIWGLCTGISAL